MVEALTGPLALSILSSMVRYFCDLCGKELHWEQLEPEGDTYMRNTGYHIFGPAGLIDSRAVHFDFSILYTNFNGGPELCFDCKRTMLQKVLEEFFK